MTNGAVCDGSLRMAQSMELSAPHIYTPQKFPMPKRLSRVRRTGQCSVMSPAIVTFAPWVPVRGHPERSARPSSPRPATGAPAVL